MAAAVRAMLYLWNGWPDDCRMVAQLAPPRERDYLLAICDRQVGKTETAKTAMRTVERHPIFVDLVEYAKKSIGLTAVPALARFWKLIEMIGEWEPFAFIDLFEQVRGGGITGTAMASVQSLQCVEFELLLVHCYEAAVGEALPQVKAEDERESLRKLREHCRRATEAKKHARETAVQEAVSQETASQATAVAAPALIKVKCPKCQHASMLPESSRGATTQCERCMGKFSVPAKNALPGITPPGVPAGLIGVRCPKCTNTVKLSATARGKTVKCATCGAAFLVPR
jgi:ribosomal protein S27E